MPDRSRSNCIQQYSRMANPAAALDWSADCLQVPHWLRQLGSGASYEKLHASVLHALGGLVYLYHLVECSRHNQFFSFRK